MAPQRGQAALAPWLVLPKLLLAPKLLLLPRSKTEFFFKVVNAEVVFVSDPRGKIIGVEHLQNGRTLEAPRIK